MGQGQRLASGSYTRRSREVGRGRSEVGVEAAIGGVAVAALQGDLSGAWECEQPVFTGTVFQRLLQMLYV